MGEKGPNKFEKEQIRKRNQQMRDEFDFSHLGNYRLVYPVLNNPVSIISLDEPLVINLWVIGKSC